MRFCIFLLLWMEFSVQGNWIPITKSQDGVERLDSEPQTQANYYYKNGKFGTFSKLAVIVLQAPDAKQQKYLISNYCLLFVEDKCQFDFYCLFRIYLYVPTYNKNHWCRNVRNSGSLKTAFDWFCTLILIRENLGGPVLCKNCTFCISWRT